MEIEKGVPLPDKPRIRSEYSKTLEGMEEGDSVVYPSAKEADALRAAGMYRGYTMKKYRDEKTGGFRVWLWKRSGAKPKQREAPSTKAPPVIATPLAALASAPLVKIDAPPMDDPRVTELHALCLARRCNARVSNAQSWVAKGVTADRLREALDTLAATGAALNVGALTPLLLQPGIQ
jgi:hypothetical protein